MYMFYCMGDGLFDYDEVSYNVKEKDRALEEGIEVCFSPEDIISKNYSVSFGFRNTIPFTNKFLDVPTWLRGPSRPW